MMRLFAHRLQAAQCPTAGGRCYGCRERFMVPPTATGMRIATLQKRPPGGRSGAARRRVPRLDSAQGVLTPSGGAT
ncbi:hypothetical protein ABIE58_001561 [Roseovarius sp. MBR-78]|jgi:hypothetical protein